MKKPLKLLSAVLSIILVLSSSGCDYQNSNRPLLYETLTTLVNIDPLLATNDTELHVVYNTYEGLMKFNKAGVLTCGVADSYSVSKDGKTYNFKLKDNLKWSDGRPLTAHDFVFAFKRAVAAETASPYAATLLPIKNVSKILSGKKSIDTIGIVALSSTELEITLDSVNTGFLELLTTPVAMPCNEEFFNSCKGYYGLNKKSVISNGYYSVTAWNDDYCSLKANEEYPLYKSSEINTVYIYFNTEDELFENIEKSEPHFTIPEKSLIDRLYSAQIDVDLTHIGNSVNSLIINPNSQLSQEKILKALMGTVEFEIEKGLTEKYGITRAQSILPSIVDYSAEITCKKATLKDGKALDLFISGCEELNVERIFPAFSIIYLKSDITESIARQIAANWQNIFGVSVNITAVENVENLNVAIRSGSFDAAIMPSTAISASPTAYLQQFTANSTTNLIGFNNKKFDSTVKKMNASFGDDLKELTTKATEIIKNYDYIYPLFVSSKTYSFKADISPQINQRNQMVYFSHLDYN